jgi:hypothetical protein
MNTITPTTALPKILAILDCVDHGPCDPEPTAVCPHCGADGRYVYHFLCEDGKVHGAMKGCIQLFPHHKLTSKIQAVFAKQRDYEKKKWKLASWDQEVIDACGALQSQTISVQDWERRVNDAFNRRNAYLAQKYPGRFGRR